MDGLAGLNAEHHILRVGIVLTEIVAIVGRDQRDAEFLLQLHEVGLDARLLRQALVLNFEIEISFAENVAKGNGGFAGGVVLPFRQALGNFALQTSGQPEKPSGVLS